ncbi:MAG: hypothetical protein ACP5MT_00425 [Candidatus Acidifodinimicrobium sp.]
MQLNRTRVGSRAGSSKSYRKLRDKIGQYINKVPDPLKYMLIAFFSFAIGVANWNKDFAIRRVVILPLLYSNFYTLGTIWYTLGFLLELFSIVCIIILGKNKYKTIPLGIVYEAASSANFWMFFGAFNNYLSKFRYEIAWNTIFFFFQVPLLVVILLYAFGAIGKERAR